MVSVPRYLESSGRCRTTASRCRHAERHGRFVARRRECRGPRAAAEHTSSLATHEGLDHRGRGTRQATLGDRDVATEKAGNRRCRAVLLRRTGGVDVPTDAPEDSLACRRRCDPLQERGLADDSSRPCARKSRRRTASCTRPRTRAPRWPVCCVADGRGGRHRFPARGERRLLAASAQQAWTACATGSGARSRSCSARGSASEAAYVAVMWCLSRMVTMSPTTAGHRRRELVVVPTKRTSAACSHRVGHRLRCARPGRGVREGSCGRPGAGAGEGGVGRHRRRRRRRAGPGPRTPRQPASELARVAVGKTSPSTTKPRGTGARRTTPGRTAATCSCPLAEVAALGPGAGEVAGRRRRRGWGCRPTSPGRRSRTRPARRSPRRPAASAGRAECRAPYDIAVGVDVAARAQLEGGAVRTRSRAGRPGRGRGRAGRGEAGGHPAYRPGPPGPTPGPARPPGPAIPARLRDPR